MGAGPSSRRRAMGRIGRDCGIEGCKERAVKLAGKVAIVTGSSRGIGKEIALVFAREGATVVVTARTETEDPRLPGTIHDTVAEIEAAGGRALAVRADALSEEEISAVAGRALEAFGRIDVLVNNAAAAAHSMPLHELPVKRWGPGDGRERPRLLHVHQGRGAQHDRARSREHHQHLLRSGRHEAGALGRRGCSSPTASPRRRSIG